MARILAITSPERGHLNPMLGPAQWLRRLGHEVAFVLLPPREPAFPPGFPVLACPGLRPAPEPLRGEALARVLEDPATLHEWIRAQVGAR